MIYLLMRLSYEYLLDNYFTIFEKLVQFHYNSNYFTIFLHKIKMRSSA